MPVPAYRPVEMYGEQGRYAYHYTTSNAAFQHILPSGQLRLNSLAKLRDPIENKDWFRQLWTGLWPLKEVEHFYHVVNKTTHETKLVSFTLDAPIQDRSPEYARGYARPRMWEQYAENHMGVCLARILQEAV